MNTAGLQEHHKNCHQKWLPSKQTPPETRKAEINTFFTPRSRQNFHDLWYPLSTMTQFTPEKDRFFPLNTHTLEVSEVGTEWKHEANMHFNTTSYRWSAKPDVPHMITDSFGSWHGTGQLPGLNNSCSTLLNSLQLRKNPTITKL